MNTEYHIKQILEYILGVPAGMISNEDTFDNLGASDVDRIEIAVQIEGNMGVEIPNKMANTMETVGELVTYVRNKII